MAATASTLTAVCRAFLGGDRDGSDLGQATLLSRCTDRSALAPLARQLNPIMVVTALQSDLSSRIAAGVLLNGRLRDMAIMIHNEVS